MNADDRGIRLITSPQQAYDTLRFVSPESPCPYLPGRASRSEVYHVDHLAGPTYERLLAEGFRRSGRLVYRPRCRGCCECRQLRVPVSRFRPTRSLRRVLRKNRDVAVTCQDPTPTEEKYDLFVRYLNAQHDETMSRSHDTFIDFLYDSPTETEEILYRLDGRLIGVSLVDAVPRGLSSVYMYFDPAFARRSPGTFSVLWEIDLCRRRGLDYYYLGYYVAGSRTMAYKARFRPNEVLVGSGRWLTLRTDEGA